jgi:hypothetical protein
MSKRAREAVKQQDQRPAVPLKPGLEHVHVEAIDVSHEAGAEPADQNTIFQPAWIPVVRARAPASLHVMRREKRRDVLSQQSSQTNRGGCGWTPPVGS